MLNQEAPGQELFNKGLAQRHKAKKDKELTASEMAAKENKKQTGETEGSMMLDESIATFSSASRGARPTMCPGETTPTQSSLTISFVVWTRGAVIQVAAHSGSMQCYQHDFTRDEAEGDSNETTSFLIAVERRWTMFIASWRTSSRQSRQGAVRLRTHF